MVVRVTIIDQGQPKILITRDGRDLFGDEGMASFVLRAFDRYRPGRVVMANVCRVFTQRTSVNFIRVRVRKIGGEERSLFRRYEYFFYRRFFYLTALFCFIPRNTIFVEGTCSFQFVKRRYDGLASATLEGVHVLPQDILYRAMGFHPYRRRDSQAMSFYRVKDRLFQVDTSELRVSRFAIFSRDQRWYLPTFLRRERRFFF